MKNKFWKVTDLQTYNIRNIHKFHKKKKKKRKKERKKEKKSMYMNLFPD